MSVHVHTTRLCCSGALGLLVLAISLVVPWWAYQPGAPEFQRARVSGRVTLGGHPPRATAAINFYSATDRRFDAYGRLHRDGSFRLHTWSNLDGEGAVPGDYRAYLTDRPLTFESAVGRPGLDPGCCDLRVHVGPDWNDFSFSLPEPAPGPTLARNP